MLSTWRAAADADHESGPDIQKSVEHVLRDGGGTRGPVFAKWQQADDDIVHSASAKDVAVLVARRARVWALVLLI